MSPFLAALLILLPLALAQTECYQGSGSSVSLGHCGGDCCAKHSSSIGVIYKCEYQCPKKVPACGGVLINGELVAVPGPNSCYCKNHMDPMCKP